MNVLITLLPLLTSMKNKKILAGNIQYPLVSVIIPAYNHQKYIQETIFSIIYQTYKNIELLIIDDGSTDITYDKICEMEIQCRKRFVSFDFATQENKGIIDTLNTLINKSRGEYVFLIASDDIAAPHAIETEHSFLDSHPDYAFCVGNNDIIDENTRRCFWDKNKINIYNITEANIFSFSDFFMQSYPDIDFLSDDFGTYYNLVYYGNHIPNGYLIRKNIFEKTGMYIKEAPLEDYWMMMQIAKFSKMKYLNDTLFFYRWHGKNSIINPIMSDFTYKTLLHELLTYSNIKEIKAVCEDIKKQDDVIENKLRVLKNCFNEYHKKGRSR